MADIVHELLDLGGQGGPHSLVVSLGQLHKTSAVGSQQVSETFFGNRRWSMTCLPRYAGGLQISGDRHYDKADQESIPECSNLVISGCIPRDMAQLRLQSFDSQPHDAEWLQLDGPAMINSRKPP
jgi:hypothetical protein